MGGSPLSHLVPSPIPGVPGPFDSQGHHTKVAPEMPPSQYTPNLFQASQQYMPQQYFGNQPIHDPSSILNAYMQHLPQFLQSTRSQPLAGLPRTLSALPSITNTPRGGQ